MIARLVPALWICAITIATATSVMAQRQAEAYYGQKTPGRDGIGKTYHGREISHVMGHLGAGWLERSSREREERTDLLLRALPLSPDDTVVDLGAGTGYFSFPMAERVPDGRVLAVDLQPEMLAMVKARAEESGVTNVVPVRATERSPNLPAGEVDLVLMVDAYHEFSYPAEVMLEVVRSLSDDGKVVLVEYRAEDPDVPIKRLHKMSVKQAKVEMNAVGLTLAKLDKRLPRQHIMIFERAPQADAAD